MFTRRIVYDRRRLLERARDLESGWRWRTALRLYRQILAAEPDCVEVHGQAAPLLARAGRDVEAWASFRVAIAGFDEGGDAGAAFAFRAEAVRALPLCTEARRTLCEAMLARGERTKAIRVLLQGAERLARKRRRGEAILLLRSARGIERRHPPVVLALARLVARDGFPGEALYLLDHLDDRSAEADRRAIRALTFRVEPSLRHAWRWWRAGRSAGTSAPRVA